MDPAGAASTHTLLHTHTHTQCVCAVNSLTCKPVYVSCTWFHVHQWALCAATPSHDWVTWSFGHETQLNNSPTDTQSTCVCLFEVLKRGQNLHPVGETEQNIPRFIFCFLWPQRRFEWVCVCAKQDLCFTLSHLICNDEWTENNLLIDYKFCFWSASQSHRLFTVFYRSRSGWENILDPGLTFHLWGKLGGM